MVVDAGGKVRANPQTGKPFVADRNTGGTPGVAVDLRQDTSLPLEVFNPPALAPVVEQQPQRQVYAPNSSYASYVPNVSVQTASSMSSDQLSPLAWNDQEDQDEPEKLPEPPIAKVDNASGNNNMEHGGPKRQAILDLWERQAAESQGRDARTTNLFGEEYDGDANMNMLDAQADYVGNTPVTDAYLRDFVDSGTMTMDDAWSMMHRPQSIDEETEMRATRPVTPGLFDSSVEKLDDGTPNYWQLTSDSMRGSQYLHYRDDLGMGGREGYIDPNLTYSKRREATNYGFIPFMPNEASYDEMVAQNLFDVPSRAGRVVANLREYLTPDYGISFGRGNSRRTVSGRDFDKNAGAYNEQYRREYQRNPDKFMSKPEGDEPYTAMVRQYMIPNMNGDETYHYGEIVDATQVADGSVQLSFADGSIVNVPMEYLESLGDGGFNYENVSMNAASSMVNPDDIASGKYSQMGDQYIDVNGVPRNAFGELTGIDELEDGTYNLIFNDGQETINVSDYTQPPVARVWSDVPNPEYVNNSVLYMPDMKMSDGTTIPYADVERLWMDKTPEDDEGTGDDDVTYWFDGIGGHSFNAKDPNTWNVANMQYGPILDALGKLPILNAISNRPARLGGQEIFSIGEDGKPNFDWSNLANNVADWTFGSLPISIGRYMPWLYSASSAGRSISGVDPMTYNPATDSYGLAAGNIDENGDMQYGVFDQDENGNMVRNEDKTRSGRMWNLLGNAAVPLSEQIVGPIGGSIIPFEKIAEKAPVKNAFVRTLINEAAGAGAEGVEEILGNLFDEMTQYGSDIYADPVIDEETGEARTDSAGREMRQHDTSAQKRVKNFFDDTANNVNSFLGGALVDAAMQGPGLPFRLKNAAIQDYARHKTGVAPYVAPKSLENREGFDPEYASLFDNMVFKDEEE